MNVIIRESERLSGLVEELLDFSRLQNGRLRLIVSRLDILSELDEAVYMFTDRARTEHKLLHYEETTRPAPGRMGTWTGCGRCLSTSLTTR